MIFDSDGTTTVVHQENTSLEKFLKNLEEGYPKIKNDHIIVNLFSFSNLSSDELLEFLNLSNRHRKAEKSFVLVSDKVSYDDIPDAIVLVPTVREAQDIIQMEEIERDLDL